MSCLRAPHSCSGWLEPFWIVSLACYAGNRCWLWAFPSSGWMSNYWNDIWMLPCAIPLVIRIYSALKLRDATPVPSGSEIGWLGLLWSVMAEGLAPLWCANATADPLDLLAYGFGGGMLWFRWHLYPCLDHGTAPGFR